MPVVFYQLLLSFSTQPDTCCEITERLEAISELKNISVGLMHLQLMHTSAAITLNENYDNDVKLDMKDFMKQLVPFSKSFRHTLEGTDDMPAHIKSSLIGTTLTISITNGRLNLGTWQGVWLMEFRAQPHTRKITVTIQGEK